VIDLATGAERAITADGEEGRYFGGVTWVYGEELGTKAGMGWSADGARLWFFAVDETGVTRRPVISDASGKIREQAYPRAGERNPVVRVAVADVTKAAPSVAWMKTDDLEDNYAPQVTWHPGGKWVAVARLDRLQTRLELLRCEAVSGECRTLLEERDPRWINLPPPPVFFDGGRQLLWLSERSGFSHIHIVGEDGLVKRQLTDGEWAVREVESVDEKGGWIYFTANAHRPTEAGVFRVPSGGGEVEMVTPEGGVHSPVFSPDSALFADERSSLEQPPRVDVFTSRGELKGTLAAADLGRYESPGVANDLFPIDTRDGLRFWAHLTRPEAFEPGRKYPVVVYVYGGPGAQVVQDHFRTSFQTWRNLLASRGILVFSMDGRGSSGRGREFETPIHRDLTAVELADQLAGVAYLKQQPYVDPDRLAVFGWSYGGTMVLKALLDAKGVFKVGVAVAPVTDWLEYDTAYTERYMQRPEDNPEGYARTSLVARASELDTPLLLAHGMADDNVHLANSARLVEELVKAGKMFELMLYPGRDHGIRGGQWRTHLFSRVTRFIEEHL
jgi:dipeptidyl-peptidase-4